jgi:hypothetical protein
VTTLLDTVDVGETAVTVPESSVFGSAASVVVAVSPTLMLVMSASAKPATTSSCPRLVTVMNADEDVDELVELEVAAPALPAAPPDAAFDVEPPVLEVDALLEPDTDSPTESLTAVTVPATGEVRVVSLSAFWSSLTVWVASATWASSLEIVAGLGVAFVAIVASVDATLACACSTLSSCRSSVCLSLVMVSLSCVQLLTVVVVEDVDGIVVVVASVEPDDDLVEVLPLVLAHRL